MVTTAAASSSTGSGAVLNGTINPLDANVYWDFQWGTDPTMSTYTDAECNIVINPYHCPTRDSELQKPAFQLQSTGCPTPPLTTSASSA